MNVSKLRLLLIQLDENVDKKEIKFIDDFGVHYDIAEVRYDEEADLVVIISSV